MTGASCGNSRHPLGWQHETAPPATRWQWGKRLSQWLNRERWGCRCNAEVGGERDDEALGLDCDPVVDASPAGGRGPCAIAPSPSERDAR